MQRAGYILAGGKSSRMGRDKARLPWGGADLLSYTARMVERVAGSAVIVGPAERYRDLNLPCINDIRAGLGPLSGIETALATTCAHLNLVLACDMPLVTEELLEDLFRVAETTGTNAVVVRDDTGRLHPLCAIYHTDCLPTVRAALDQGRLRMMDLLEVLHPQYLDVAGSIANVNTPEEWHAARSS